MFDLTRQERFALICLIVVFLIGISFHYAVKKHPRLSNIVNVMESSRIYQKINLNTATAEELERLPYIGNVTSHRIVDYRKIHGNFRDVKDVQNVKGIYTENFERFKHYLHIR